mmetsp:Transcript_86838/g.280557  ORF Transcript_86838/g.280557 Transcript_86838/m.280557 type:complete len:175 (-) Transcript_86838:162-686(-)
MARGAPTLLALALALLSSAAALLPAEGDVAVAAATSEANDECANGVGEDGSCSVNALQMKAARVNRTIEAEAEAGVFKCGAGYCTPGSICCKSRNINAAICCSAGTVCRFSEYDYESGIRFVNEKGLGSPRCYACTDADPENPGCANPNGGSEFYGPLTSADADSTAKAQTGGR